MADYDNTNRGTLFLNDKKGKETRPDWKGTINVEGVEYYINCWDKISKDGKTHYRSLSLTAKTEIATEPEPKFTSNKVELPKDNVDRIMEKVNNEVNIIDDDIPF